MFTLIVNLGNIITEKQTKMKVKNKPYKKSKKKKLLKSIFFKGIFKTSRHKMVRHVDNLDN